MPNPNTDPRPVTIQTAIAATPEIRELVEDMFAYHAWTKEQTEAGTLVRKALADATLVIIQNVPPSADRSTAIRKLREARMDANSAITHGGKY